MLSPGSGLSLSDWGFPTLGGGQILEKENSRDPSVTSVCVWGGGREEGQGVDGWNSLLGNEAVSQPIHLGTINISVS